MINFVDSVYFLLLLYFDFAIVFDFIIFVELLLIFYYRLSQNHYHCLHRRIFSILECFVISRILLELLLFVQVRRSRRWCSRSLMPFFGSFISWNVCIRIFQYRSRRRIFRRCSSWLFRIISIKLSKKLVKKITLEAP